MESQNFYNQLACVYDNLMDNVDYNQWTSFIIENIKDKRLVLEAACGTGNITSLLAPQGYNITAFDVSQSMLVKAYEKLRRYRNVRILNQNMLSFKFDKIFDSCLCCCDGVNYLKLEDNLIFFTNVYKHLNAGGIFIFDISTKYKYINMEDTYVYEDENIFYVWENCLDKDNKKLEMEINFFIRKDDIYERFTEFQTHYIYNNEEIKKLLKNIGFSNINIFDNYTNNNVRNNSSRATFVCVK